MARINIYAYQPGIFPRSENVVAATRGLDRGRATAGAADQAYRQDLEAFIELQREAGLDLFSDGLLRWQDIFRPLVEASPALRARTLVRWFDNNAFFRAPELVDPARPLAAFPGALVEDGTPEPRVGTLPSPFMFSRAVQGARNRNDLMVELARELLRPGARGLAEAGCRLVHLQEPWLAFYGIEAGDWKPFADALSSIREDLGAGLVLHLSFGDVTPHLERLRSLPIDALGVDLVETDLDALGRDWEIGLVAGCLDGRSSLLESAEATAELARMALERVRPPELYLSSNSDLEFLPLGVARQKVLRLGEAARRARELLTV